MYIQHCLSLPLISYRLIAPLPLTPAAKKNLGDKKVAATTASNTATRRDTMDFGSKRRKLDHGGQGIRHKGLIDFESRDATRLSAASTFVLKTDELLKEIKLDSVAAFKGLDSQLHQIKGIIDSIEPHDATPVCHNHAVCEGRAIC